MTKGIARIFGDVGEWGRQKKQDSWTAVGGDYAS